MKNKKDIKNTDIKADNKTDNKPKKLTLADVKSALLIAFKKIILIFLAILMVICVIPVGFLKSANKVDRRGELIRVLPSAAHADVFSRDYSSWAIGENSSALMTFDLAQIENLDIKDISSVRLRLSFISGTGMLKNKVAVTMPASDNNFDNAVKITNLYQNKLCRNMIYNLGQCQEIYPNSFQKGNGISTADVTEQAIDGFKSKDKKLTLAILSQNKIPAYLASDKYSDPYCKPYLEIVTKKTVVSTPSTSFKTSLTDAVYLSSAEGDINGEELSGKKGGLICGQMQDNSDNNNTNNTNEVYIKFDINRDIIEGSIYRARLTLKSDLAQSINPSLLSSALSVTCLPGENWQSQTITYNNRPKAKENALPVVASASSADIYADVTQEISEAYRKGYSSVTFCITSKAENIFIYGKGAGLDSPTLYINSTDKANIACGAKSALSALGKNGENYVTKDLLSSYTDSDTDMTANIKWQELNYDKNRRNISYLSEDGKITRPKWYEGDVNIIALARIFCGGYTTTRRFPITIRAEAGSDYSSYSFDNYIKIGDTKSEEAQKFESVNTDEAKRRLINSNQYTYRCLKDSSCMVLNLSVTPVGDNYLTLKLSVPEHKKVSFVVSPVSSTKNNEKDSICLDAFNFKAYNQDNIDESKNTTDNIFSYYTVPIPESLTKGKKNISLRLTCRIDDNIDNDITDTESILAKDGNTIENAIDNQPNDTLASLFDYKPSKPQKSLNSDPKIQECRFFAAYMTQNSFFDPGQFAKQGEIQMGETSLLDDTDLFLKNAMLFLKDTDIKDPVLPLINADADNPQKGLTTQNPIDDESITESAVSSPFIPNDLIISNDGKAILAANKTCNIAFKINTNDDNSRATADIYESCQYYNRISKDTKLGMAGENLLLCEFGKYLLLYNQNPNDLQAAISDEYKKKGIYKNITDNNYYVITDKDLSNTEEYTEYIKKYGATLPTDAYISPFNTLTVKSKGAVLLKRSSPEIEDQQWHITNINGMPASELYFKEKEPLTDVTVSTADDLSDNITDLTLVLGLYKGNKTVSLKTIKTSVVQSIDVYTFDLSDFDIKIENGCELRFFVYDNQDNLVNLKPILSYP